MKKTLTLTVALALVALGSVSWAATSPKSSGSMQKQPETDATNLNSSRSNIYGVKVTQVNEKDKTFTVEVTFSAKAIPLPKEKEKVDVIYTPNPTGEPPEALVNTSRSNTFRLTRGQSAVTGKVLSVNSTNKTFAVEVTFTAEKLALPEVGKVYDITFTGPTTAGGPLRGITINGSKSNSF